MKSTKKVASRFQKFLLQLIVISTILLLIIVYRNVISDNSTHRVFESYKFQSWNNTSVHQSLHYTKEQLEKIQRDRTCYEVNDSIEKVQFLDDIENPPPKPDKSIFFVSTSCVNDAQITLTARESCAVESAASQNPNHDVYVLFLSPVGFVSGKSISPLITSLKTLPNVYFRNVNIYEFSRNTPAEDWIKRDEIFLSPFFKTQMSDYVRFVTLYKFGGIYFDMDYVVVKSVDGIPSNFAPFEKENDVIINASVLGFAANGTGHRMIDMILRECIEKYDPNLWLNNGPEAVIRAILRICKLDNPKAIDKMKPEFCDGLKIMPRVVFFPLNPKEAVETEPHSVEEALKKVTEDTVGIHIWTSHTRDIDILKSGPPMFYTIMAEKFCPKSYGASGSHFN